VKPGTYTPVKKGSTSPGSPAQKPPKTTGKGTLYRFDAQGRVLIHKDFWDSGSGFYEQLPGLGRVVGRVRATVEASARGEPES